MKRAAFFIVALALMASGFGCTGRQAPQPATPTNTISMNGGNSATGTGGSPGWLAGYTYGAPIIINSSGTVDASFTLPPYTSYYGANGVTISSNTIVQLNQNPVAGGLFMNSADNTDQIYVGSVAGDSNTPVTDPGDTNATAVTGLVVNQGATLTLPGNSGGNCVAVFADDLTINGLVNTTATGGNFDIEAGTSSQPVNATGNITIGSSGEVDGTRTGAAGDSIYLGGGTVINQGTLNANGDAGKDGGYVDMEASSYTVNTGTIEANGGDGSADGGGSGNQGISLASDYGNVYNSGYLYARGGNGSNGNGGMGGSVYMIGCDQANSNGLQGDILASGLIDVSGGNGTGNGGGHGLVDFHTWAQGMEYVNATINGNGGNSTGTGYGGEAAKVEFFSDGDDETNPVPSVGAIQVDSQFNLNGGNGESSAPNSNYSGIEIEANNYIGYLSGNYNASASVAFYTTGSIAMNAGNGYAGGGNAGNGGVYLYTYSPTDYTTDALLPAGSITFQPDVSNQGGAVTDSSANSYYGGNGGLVDIEAAAYYNANLSTYGNNNVSGAIANITGSMNLNAGSGGNGGSASAQTVYPFQLGGAGSQESVFIAGQTVLNSGNISANGGNGQANGGNGGDVYMDSYLLNTYNTGPTPSVSGGSGTPPGTAGTVTIR